jgi:hypothetical protein
MVTTLALMGCVTDLDSPPEGDAAPISWDETPSTPGDPLSNRPAGDLGCGEDIHIREMPNGQVIIIRVPYECQPVFQGTDWDHVDPVADELYDEEDWQEDEWGQLPTRESVR